jgi:hypothetical protein
MMTQKKNADTTIEEIHRTRREMADKFGGNIVAILEDARKRQAASGRPVMAKSIVERGCAVDRGPRST